MKPTDLEIAQACRDGVRRALGLPITARAADRVERRTRTQRRSGRGGSGTRDDVIDFSLYGLQNFSATNYLQTANPGGEPGTASGFGGFLLVRLNSLGAAIQLLTERLVGAAGYTLYMTAANLLTVECKSGGGISSAATYQFVASDVGRVIAIAFQHTGSAVRLLVSRVQSASGDVAITGYTAASGVTSLGIRSGGTFPFTTGMVLSEATFTGTPSVAQLQACFDVIRTIGDLPDTMSGATVTHLWSAKRELAGVSNPAGRKTYGARGWNSPSVYDTPTGVGTGVIGSASGFFAQVRIRVDAITGSATYLMTRGNASTQGYLIDHTGTALSARAGDGAAYVVTPVYTLSSADLGRTLVMTLVYDQPAGKLRLYIDGVEVGTGTAITAYAPLATSTVMRIGAFLSANSASSGVSIFQASGGNIVPTQAALAAQASAAELAGKLTALASSTHFWDFDATIQASGTLTVAPATVADSIGSDTLTKTGTVEVAVATATAPTCPTQLTDRITGAAGDALARVGAPSVKIVDPTAIDGRRTLGPQGFSAANYFQSANGLAGSASGHWISWFGRVDSLPASFACLVGRRNTSPQLGYDLTINGSNVYFENHNGTTIVFVSTPLTTAMLGVPKVFTGVFTGSVIRLYVDGVPWGGDVACSGGYSPSALPFRVGQYGDASFPASTVSWFGAAGGTGVPTLQQVADHAAATLAASRMQSIPSLTSMLHDPSTDTLASGVDAVPATVLDRVGTDHLTRVGIDVRADANSIRGVGPYGVADGWQTAPGGGVQGAAGGWHIALDVWFTKVPTAAEMLASASNSGATTGYFLQCNVAALRGAQNGGGVSSSYTVTGSDLNKRTRILLQSTGSSGVIRLYVNSSAQVGADVVTSTFAANGGVAMILGQFYGAQNFSSGYIEACEGGNAVLTSGEIATLFADLTTALPTISGKTLKRYVFEQDIAAVSGALPARSVERISGGDDLVRVGAPLTLAQRTERLWSYETSSIMQTSLSPTAADRWLGAANAGLGGDAVGWFVAPLIRCTGALGGRFLTHSDGGVGWAWNGQAGGGVLIFQAVDGVGSKSAPSFALSPDGKVRPLLAVYDVPTGFLRSYANKAQIGTGTAISGYNTTGLSSLGCALGGFFSGGSGNASYDVIGFVFGYGVPTFAEFRAWEDACLAAEDIVALGGAKSAHMYSVKRGRTAGQLTDLIGTAHLALNGTPTITDIYSRAFAA